MRFNERWRPIFKGGLLVVSFVLFFFAFTAIVVVAMPLAGSISSSDPTADMGRLTLKAFFALTAGGGLASLYMSRR